MLLLIVKLKRFTNATSEEYVRVKLYSALKQLLFTHGLFKTKYELKKYVEEEFVPPNHLVKQKQLREKYTDNVYYLIILALGVICSDYSVYTKRKVDDLIKTIYLIENKNDTWLTWNGKDFMFFQRRV